MKIDDIAKQFAIDKNSFIDYMIKEGRINVKFLAESHLTIDDLDFDESYAIDRVKEYKRALPENELQRQKKLAEAEAEKQRACSNMLITSGFNFDGYRITKYSGYISGDDAIQIDRGMDGIFFSKATDVGQALTDSLVKIRRRALAELKEAAYDLGCNAVIGVDFDYITLDPETANSKGGTTYLPYVFCVTANGNAVVIEKDDSK